MPANTSKPAQECEISPSLQQRTIIVENEKTGQQNIPALDKYWATRSVFANYTSLLTAGGYFKSGVALEEWQQAASNFCEDMEFLLRCKHHEFWSYMIYQQSIRLSIASFLQRAVPIYLYENFNILSNEIEEIYENALCLVLRISFRMLTTKESFDDWIDKDHHLAIISKHNLLTVPMIFDLMIAIGNIKNNDNNESLMEKLLKKYLELMGNTIQNDLKTSLHFFHNAFRSIRTQVVNEGCEGATGGLLPDENTSNLETQFDDVTLFTLDCVYTLKLLLELWPSAKELCNEVNLDYQIADFYTDTLKLLYRNLYQCNPKASALKWLNMSRVQLLQCFRNLVATDWLNLALNNPNLCDVTQIEQYLNKLEEFDCFEEFIVDYLSCYPLEKDYKFLETLNGFSNVSLKMCSLMEKYSRKISITTTLNNDKNDRSFHLPISEQILNNGLNNQDKPSQTTQKRDIELEITMVLDCLPQLETEFVRKLLARYDNSELAIAAYLENNLPPDLIETEIQPNYNDREQRQLSTYDKLSEKGKEIYLMKRGKGFPIGPQNALELLDDKSDLDTVRHRYQQYTLVSEDDDDDNSDNCDDNNDNCDDKNDLYDDEYDDSYEGLLNGTVVRCKNNNRSQFRNRLAENVIDTSDNESIASNTNDENMESSNRDHLHSKSSRNNLDFCEDPAVMRARREAQYRAKWAKKGVSIDGVANVKGRPKGQGQDKEVLLNRQKKRINKSHGGNHNRKAGATFKRNRGMF